ncbi:MAG: amidohydrolase family protein [Planctomycetota bacterium]
MNENSHPIIDAHVHLWNRIRGQVRGEVPVRAVSNGRITIGDNEILGMPATMLDCQARAELLIAEMDAAGVNTAVVVQEYLDGEQNDYLLHVASQYPDRFFVHGLPDWFSPDQLTSQINSLLNRGFKGIKLPAHQLEGTIELDGKRLLIAFQAIADADAILAVDLSEGQSQVPAFRRIMDKHPSMRVAIGHFGMPSRGGWPGQLELCHYKNVYVETGGIIWLYRDHGIAFYPAVEAITNAIDLIGCDKIMWGSDWPRTMVDFTYTQAIDFLVNTDRISETSKNKILGLNALRLYGEIQKPRSSRLNRIPRITDG